MIVPESSVGCLAVLQNTLLYLCEQFRQWKR